ncbi:hypothetical protein GOODEAATRI_021764, partial [Goodea atripinnis]
KTVDEVKKSEKNHTLITKLMHTTFALRCKEIISDDLPVAEILNRWPAMKIKSQPSSLFARRHLCLHQNLGCTFWTKL